MVQKKLQKLKHLHEQDHNIMDKVMNNQINNKKRRSLFGSTVLLKNKEID
jgi:hypothetical protein